MTATPMPAAPTAASDPLRVALQGVLDEAGGRFGGVARLARRPSPYGSSSTLEELDVVLDDGGELALVFKDLGPHARSVAAREARPSDLHDPLREIEAYRRVLAPASLSTAAFIGAVTEPALGRYWLFLERVPGVGLDQVGSVEVWAAAAAWLGRMHRSVANQTARLECEPHLLRYDAGHFAGWARRAVHVARQARSRDESRTIEWISVRYLGTVERLAAMPRTFVHGDCYASNVLVEAGTDSPRVCPVDWELAGVGPGPLDLAALVAGDWTEEPRAAIVGAYREAFDPGAGSGGLPRGPGPDASNDRFLDDLDRCSLYLAMRCLTRSPKWPAPPQHARDWVAEGLRLAERVGD